jgi:two-component system response regulator CpxR
MHLETKKLLIIDDDIEMCELLTPFLTIEGYQVEVTHTGYAGIKAIQSNTYDLILLDVGLPDINGFKTLTKIRSFSQVLVLMLTARGDYDDRIRGLEFGADDYLPKPYNSQELLARINALLRRNNPSIITNKVLVIDEFTLHLKTKEAYKTDKKLNLTTTEFTILKLLLEYSDNLISKEELTELALGRQFTLFDRAIDMHVSNVRKKTGVNIHGKTYIKTVRGLGYKYCSTAD